MTSESLILQRDTIVAIATPNGRAGIGVIRLAGPAAFAIAKALTGKQQLTIRQPQLCHLKNAVGELIDQALLLAFASPRSFTGDDLVEIHAHGSPFVLDALIETTSALGARLANPGEFSMRAFLAGKLDLAQAEAIADLIDSQSQQAARAAARSLEGEFSRQVQRLGAGLLELRAFIEAAIDFSDEEIDFLSEQRVDERLTNLRDELQDLVEEAQRSLRVREQRQVVLCGRPNVGKSSLLNLLSGRDSAIVTAIAGTTRDVLREEVQLAGLSIELLDTAGLRDATDPVEEEGVRRARDAVQTADHVLLVVDARDLVAAGQRNNRDLEQLLVEYGIERSPEDVTLVINKVDLVTTAAALTLKDLGLCVCALDRSGVETLRNRLRDLVQADEVAPRFLARRRHIVALQNALDGVGRAVTAQVDNLGLELAAEELRCAQVALVEVVGEVTSDALLGEIFSRFCIGK